MSVKHNIVYQVDWTCQDRGRFLSATKREITWKFGFTNMDALQRGTFGVACRGEEHEIQVCWSIASGKCDVIVDGEQVYHSQKRAYAPTYSTAFVSKGHSYKIMCHSVPPRVPEKDFRQYELIVDGVSFVDMKKIFQLGCDVPDDNFAFDQATHTKIASGDAMQTIPEDHSFEDVSLGDYSVLSDSRPVASVSPKKPPFSLHKLEIAKWRLFHDAPTMV